MRFPGSDNPVYQSTLRQLQARPRRRGWRWVVSNGLYGLMLALALIVYFGQWAGLLLWRDAYPIVRELGGLLTLLMLYAIFTHVGIVFRTLLTAATLISSARATATWDLLVLTGVPARQIVSGMWWAVQRATLSDWLRLLPLRLGAVTYLAVASSYPLLYIIGPLAGYGNLGMKLVPPSPLGLLLLVPLSLLLSLAAGAVTAAIGLCASALVKRVSVAIAVAFTVMLVLLGVGVLVGVLGQRGLVALFPPSDFAGTATFAELTTLNTALALSWFDNGAVYSSALIRYDTTSGPVDAALLWTLFRTESHLGFSGVTFWVTWGVLMAVLAGVTVALLRLARRAVTRAGALP